MSMVHESIGEQCTVLFQTLSGINTGQTGQPKKIKNKNVIVLQIYNSSANLFNLNTI